MAQILIIVTCKSIYSKSRVHYIFVGHEIKVKWNGKKGRGCKIGMPKGFKKVKANVKKAQEQFLRQLRDGQDVC